MLWSGVVLVLVLGLGLGVLGYCKYRAVHRLDVVGVDRIAKPTGLPPLPDGTEDQAPVEYEYFNKRGVSDVHRVGAQIFDISKIPVSALILIGLLLIARALWYKPPSTTPAAPIDPLAD
jgi:hypothetical protein